MIIPTAHAPLIEGLRHGGLAQVSRRALTAFGSGWRGIVAVSGGEARFLMGSDMGRTLIGVDDLSNLLKSEPTTRLGRYTISDLREALDYHRRTGFLPILINKDYFGPNRLPFEVLKETIRHERIHALHFKNPNSSFIQKKIADSPSLYDSVFMDQVRVGEWAVRASKRSGITTADVRRRAHNLAEETVRDYQERYAGDKTLLESERLAFANQDSKTFFRAAESAGLKLPQKAGVIPPVSKALTAAAHEPVIEALHHGGWAQKIRKLLTSFGSGWQGLDITRTLRLLDTSHTANALTSLSKSIHTRAGARAMSKAL